MKRPRGEAAIGWIEFSPIALRRMRREMESAEQGVVDEVGVLTLHTGYAERFFPGMSVLHTRPRYLFFTCWNYLWMRSRSNVAKRGARRVKEAAELWVTERLRRSGARGIIGGTIYPRPPVQSPDFIYWTALRRFGFYRGVGRSALLGDWEGARVGLAVAQDGDEEREALGADLLGQFNAPPPPAVWGKGRAEPLTFDLTRREAELLRTRLVALGPECLLARAAVLAHRINTRAGVLWEDPLIWAAAGLCGETARIERARLASALARLLRVLYAALVEQVRWQEAGPGTRARLPDPWWWRRHLRSFWATSDGRRVVADAGRIDLDLLRADLGKVSPSQSFLALVRHVQGRLQRCTVPRSVDRLLLDGTTEERVRVVEWERKGDRARLPRTAAGRERRAEFGRDTVTDDGLHYRWPQVRTLLADLRAGLRKRTPR